MLKKTEEDDRRKETDSPRRSITPNAANGKCLKEETLEIRPGRIR